VVQALETANVYPMKVGGKGKLGPKEGSAHGQASRPLVQSFIQNLRLPALCILISSIHGIISDPRGSSNVIPVKPTNSTSTKPALKLENAMSDG
jgi:hypothetical protein